MTDRGLELGLDQYAHGFSVRNRLQRFLWSIVQATAFSWSPAPLHGWRRMLLRIFGANIHQTAHIYPTARIWAPWNLEMGKLSCLSWGVDCYCVARIRLGDYALVSQHARLIAASHSIRSPNFQLVYKPIELQKSSWVCAYAYVGMGVTVGEGAVVAATATVVKDVDSWAIVGGNPTRQIGKRTIEAER